MHKHFAHKVRGLVERSFRMKKRILAIIMAMCLCLGMSTVAFAAEDNKGATEISTLAEGSGTSTWNGADYQYVGSFTMEGNNLTPVKTMGKAGKLTIHTCFGISNGKNGYVVVQIRDASSGKVLAELNRYKKGLPASNYQADKHGDTVSTTVKKGQKVQIYFKVLDQNGKYQDGWNCGIRYYYSLK